MPTYKQRFLVETSIVGREDLHIHHGEHTVTLLLANKLSETEVEVEFVCQANDHREAFHVGHDRVLAPVLDAISFHRNTPTMIQGITRVLRSEPGQPRRRAVLIETRRSRGISRLDQGFVEDIEGILRRMPAVRESALRWLRNTRRPLPIVERFVFAWLALENAAGETMIDRKCPHCEQSLPTYRAANREGAFAILKASDATLERETFNGWWNRLRNRVFHGGSVPEVGFLEELGNATDKIIKAVERHFDQALEPKWRNQANRAVPLEHVDPFPWFVDFAADEPQSPFPTQVPDPAALRQSLNEGRRLETEPLRPRLLKEEDFRGW